MQRFCIGLALLTVIASPAAGLAEVEGIYLAVNGGTNFRGDVDLTLDGTPAGALDFLTGFHFGAAVGVKLNDHFRVETEISYRENSVDLASGIDAKVRSATVLVNGFYDFAPLGPVRPFVGGGVGLGVVHTTSLSMFGADDDDTALAYQLTAGVGWDFRPLWTLSLGYRYLATTDTAIITPVGNLEAGFDSHELVLGIRCLFDL